VTLKVISEKYLGDQSARLRFLREARAAARLRHSNVASVLHLSRTGSSYFYAMEFVEGETLENLIKRSGRLEVKLALEILAQVAAGLTAVHKHKLVHRDIKPNNVMVNLEEGGAVAAKIIDLGLAKPAPNAPAEVAISTPGAFAGTPVFASPVILLEKDPGRRFQDPAELLKAVPTITAAIDARRRITRQSLQKTPSTALAVGAAVASEKRPAAALPATGLPAACLDLLLGGSDRMDHQSEMCATPNDQPGDQKNQRQKNRRGDSQPACKPAPVDLRKISDRSYVRCVSSTEAIKRQDSRDDAAVNQNIRNASYCWNHIEKEVLLFGQKRIARLRCGVGDDCVPGEEERLGGHQPGESLHDEIIFVLDLIPDGSIPIGGTKHIDCGNAHGL
jgi:hypothetical protein